jgi:hypothetical protein
VYVQRCPVVVQVPVELVPWVLLFAPQQIWPEPPQGWQV